MGDGPVAEVVARVLDLDEMATPGRWSWGEQIVEDIPFGPMRSTFVNASDGKNLLSVSGMSTADAEWIASTRTDAVTLAREVQRLTDKLDSATEALAAARAENNRRG